MSEHEHPPQKATEKKPAQNEVARKAYAIYLKEGRPQDHDVQNWLEAEAQMNAKTVTTLLLGVALFAVFTARAANSQILL